MPKVLFVILDGAADCGKDTPLHVAVKPNLDKIASNSFCGSWRVSVPPGYNVRSLSELATLELLGYAADESPGRGVLEALGADLKLNKNSVYFRANFATVGKRIAGKGIRIISRRAGRDEIGFDSLAKMLDMNIGGYAFRFYRTIGHRGVLKISGNHINANLSDGDHGSFVHAIEALKPNAKKLSEAVNTWLETTHKTLLLHSVNKRRKFPANYILLRGAGVMKHTEPFHKRWGMNAACVASDGMVKGVARYLGMKVLDVPGATGKTDTDLNAKLRTSLDAFKDFDFVLLHIKGLDVASHAQDIKMKISFIERLDREIFLQIAEQRRNIYVIITADHATSSKTGEHTLDRVPFIIYNPDEEMTGVRGFDEMCCNSPVVGNPMKRLMLELRGCTK